MTKKLLFRLITVVFCFGTGPVLHAETAAQDAKPVVEDVVLVLDNSGSMHKIDPGFLLKQAVARLVPASGNSDRRLGIIIYDRGATMATPLTPATAEHGNEFRQGIEQINYRGRYTNIAVGMERAIYELKAHGREQAERAIVLLTDGVIDTGDASRSESSARWLREDLVSDAAHNNISLYTVAFGGEADFELLHILAHRTHGDYVRIDSAKDMAVAFDHIMAGIAARGQRAMANRDKTREEQLAEVGVEDPEPMDEAATAANPGVGEMSPPQPALAPSESAASESATGAGGQSGDPVLAPAATTEGLDGGVETAESSSAHLRTDGLKWLERSPYNFLIAFSLALAVFEIYLYARRSKPERPRREPPLYPRYSLQAVPEAFLQDMTGIQGYETFRIDKPWTFIGRYATEHSQEANEIILASSTIGRQHAAIEYRDEGFWLTDRRSRNGTYVNGERVTAPVLLKHGDLIRFHDFEFRFTLAALDNSDETMISGVLPDWALEDASHRSSATLAMVTGPSDSARSSYAEATKPVQQDATRRATAKTAPAKGFLDDITLPTDEAVKKALDKYFDASNY